MGIGTAGNEPPDLLRRDLTDLFVEAENPLPGNLVPRVDEDPEVGRHVLDVRLFKEPDAGADLEGNPPAGQLHLHLHRMVVRPVEDGDLPKRDTAPVDLQDSLGDEIGLLEDVPGRDKDGADPPLPHGPQRFLKLAFVVRDAQVRQMEDLRRAPVVRL